MNRPIKFRGHNYFTGELHYGFYLEDEDGANILENNRTYLVDPDTVAQLVGFDKNGREVYEGDQLDWKNGSGTIRIPWRRTKQYNYPLKEDEQ